MQLECSWQEQSGNAQRKGEVYPHSIADALILVDRHNIFLLRSLWNNLLQRMR